LAEAVAGLWGAGAADRWAERLVVERVADRAAWAHPWVVRWVLPVRLLAGLEL